MTEGDYILGKKPDREIPREAIGKLEPAPDSGNAGPDQRETAPQRAGLQLPELRRGEHGLVGGTTAVSPQNSGRGQSPSLQRI